MSLKPLILAMSAVCLFLAPVRLFGAGSYFRVEQRAGVWWFVSPSGQLLISAGVDNVFYRGDVIRGTTVHPYSEHVSQLYPSQDA